MNDNDNTQWGIVELMGHKVVAGRISKSEEFGTVLLRVDVPATSSYPEFTQLYGNSSIYCVTFTSEEVARLTAESAKVNPVSVYVPELITREKYEKTVQEWRDRLTQMRGLPSGLNDDDDDEEDEEDPGRAGSELEWEEDDSEDDLEDDDEFDKDED